MKNVEPISFYEMMRASHVKRWHIINTSKEQNLAEHQWNVTVIGLQLHKLLTEELPSEILIGSLLFHDIAEIRYGDIPTPGKAFIRRMLEDADYEGDFFGVMDSTIVPATPYIGGHGLPFVQRLVHMADLIEAAWWLRENGRGYHAGVVATKLWKAVEDYTNDIGWHAAVNSVLQSLGMPYVSKEMADNPP